jgi:predicted ATP-dependent serine protease
MVAWICEFCDLQWPQLQKRCVSCKRWKGGKRSLPNKKDKQEQTVSKDKEKKRGRKSKTLRILPAQEVDIPLVVGGASCSPLTGGINTNDSSIGPSVGMSSYDDATIGENTVS